MARIAKTETQTAKTVGKCANCEENANILHETNVGYLCDKCFTEFQTAMTEKKTRKPRVAKTTPNATPEPSTPTTESQEIREYIEKVNRYLSGYGMYIKKIKLERIQQRETVIDLPKGE